MTISSSYENIFSLTLKAVAKLLIIGLLPTKIFEIVLPPANKETERRTKVATLLLLLLSAYALALYSTLFSPTSSSSLVAVLSTSSDVVAKLSTFILLISNI